MFQRFINKGRQAILAPQSSILSAATLIMIMVVAVKVLGFIRQRVLFAYFSPAETDLFLAAFELPDLFFEVFVFSSISAAFIPVFSGYISKGKEKTAWHVAKSETTIIFVIFSLVSVFILIFAKPLYQFVAGDSFKLALGIEGGFSEEQIDTVVMLSRFVLLAQLFFVFSSFLTGISESYKRFLGPSLAPILYNLGIIFGIIFLAEKYDLAAPVIGAIFGALLHLAVQLPAVWHTGYRYKITLDFRHPGVRKFFRLSIPRMIEMAFLQLRRFTWLFLGSLYAGGFTYLKSADLLQALPVGVFGLSLSKAALPTLSQYAGKKETKKFSATLLSTLNQVLFLVVPISVFLIVLRVPIVRLVFGASQFDWNSTLQTGYVLTAFSIGIFAYSANLLINRAFYALQNTKVPVLISISSTILSTVLAFVFVLKLRLDIWSIALAYAISSILQMLVLTRIILLKTHSGLMTVVRPFIKVVFSSLVSGMFMFMLIKIFDRSVWVKRLSFLGRLEQSHNLPFELFVVDTRYTQNLLALTFFVGTIGVVLYVAMMFILKSEELWAIANYTKRIFKNKKFEKLSLYRQEQYSPNPTDPDN